MKQLKVLNAIELHGIIAEIILAAKVGEQVKVGTR